MRASTPLALTVALIPLLVAAGLTGCQGSRIDGDGAVAVITSWKPERIAAGETAEVVCTIVNANGLEVVGATSFTISPDHGQEVMGVGMTPYVADTYNAVCSAPTFELVDEDGADLVVDPAAPATVTTVLEQEVIPVYTTTGVDCIVEDPYGNIVPIETIVTAPEEVTVGDGVVSSAEVGTYTIACELPESAGGGYKVLPADLEVTPADPATIELKVKADAAVYFVEQKVDFWWVVSDVHGNVISGLPATFDVPAEGVQTVDEELHEYRLMEEGHFTFTVTLDPPWDALTDSRTLVVDESGPDILIDWPIRGDTVEGDGDFMTVEGQVIDAWSDIEYLQINGEDVDIADDGSFAALMLPEWGVNIIHAWAEDVHGNSTKLTPTFAYSSDWHPMEGGAKAVVQTDAVALLLGQDFLDDGDHDHRKPNDLATLLEILLADADIAELVAGFGNFDLLNVPIIDQDLLGGVLHIGGEIIVTAGVVDPTDIGPTTVTIDSRLGGIDTLIEMGTPEEEGMIITLAIGVEVPIVFSWTVFGGGDITLTGSADLLSEARIASLLLGTKVDMQKAPGGELQVEVTQLTLDTTGLQIDPIEDIVLHFELDLGFINPSFDFALSDLVGDISQLTDGFLDPITEDFVPFLLDLLAPLIQGFVDDIIIGVLGALETEAPFPLPELLGLGPADLDMATELSSVQFFPEAYDGATGEYQHAGGGQIGIGIGFYSDKNIDRDPIGAIQRGGCLKGGGDDGFVYDWEKTIGGALKTDWLNAGAFAVWFSSYLNGSIDLGGLLDGGSLPIPLSDPVLQLEWLLPPVWNDCSKSGAIELQMGDLYVDLKANLLGSDIEATMFVDVSIGLFFEGTDEGLTVTVGEFGFFDVEVLTVSEDVSELLDIKDLLENGLEDLLGSFVVGQSFGPIEIPPIALDGFLPGIPEGTALQLGNFGVDRDDGYIVIGGDLE